VYGHWYTETCNDTGDNQPLCPLPDVTLTVTLPGGDQTTLGPFQPAGPDMGFRAILTIPPDTGPGVVTVSDSSPMQPPYTFTVAPN
jgi:hypothetical protein